MRERNKSNNYKNRTTIEEKNRVIIRKQKRNKISKMENEQSKQLKFFFF